MDKNGISFFGKYDTTIIATVSGGILLLVLTRFVGAPERAQEKAAKADASIRTELQVTRREIAELREAYQEHRTNAQGRFEELAIRVDNGTQDRFTKTEALVRLGALKELQNAHNSQVEAEIKRLNDRLNSLQAGNLCNKKP